MPAKSTPKPPKDDTILSSVDFTLGDWKVLRNRLASNAASTKDWVMAFDVLYKRWQKRYLDPIQWIHEWNGPAKAEGEGFAIMTIASCLFEAVAAAYSGKIYHYDDVVRKQFHPWAYKDSACCYTDVLKNHPVFKDSLSGSEIDETRFYRGIRCGLIHEARTKAEFKINTNFSRSELAWKDGDATIINRHAFVQRLVKMIDRMETDIRDNADIKGRSCRLNLARHMDWTFGLFDVEPIQVLEREKTVSWWVKP